MGQFSRKVQVKLVDDRTGTVIAKTKSRPELLPESFFANTTMHLGDTDWSVVSADPMTRGEYSKRGELVIRARPVETVDPKELLYSLPTICDALPASEGVAANGAELVFGEDDWRQCELVSESLRPVVERELADIRMIHEQESVGPGFRRVHVRSAIPAPIQDGAVSLADLNALVGARLRLPIRLEGAETRVSDLFATPLHVSHLLYALHAGPSVQVIGLHPGLPPNIAGLKELAVRSRLLFVDWCRCVVTRPEDLA
jgi:hypothetical protein